MEQDFEGGPSWCAEQTPCPGRQDEGVPGRDGERAHEEVLVGAQMRRQVERRWELGSDAGHGVTGGPAGYE